MTASSPQTLRYLLLGLCLALPCPLFAQQSGAINGTVTDESGGAIPNAHVTVINAGQGTVFKTVTNIAREYSAPALKPDSYNVRIAAPAFKTFGPRVSMFRTYRDISNQSGNCEPARWNAAATTTIDEDGSITCQSGTLVPGGGDIFNGLVRCGLKGVSQSGMTGHLFNPAPRIGFADDVFGNGKLSVRGGYGIFFERTNGNESYAEALEGPAPVVQTPNQFNQSRDLPEHFFRRHRINFRC